MNITTTNRGDIIEKKQSYLLAKLLHDHISSIFTKFKTVPDMRCTDYVIGHF